MVQINNICMLKIALEGFKCFKYKEFTCGDLTYIVGKNATGKSTIADAIAYVFTGTNFFGEKNIDKLHHNTCKELQVQIEFYDEIGEVHTLIRTHKNDTTSINYDGYRINQSNVNELFGEKDLFLSIFNPLYLIEVLGAKGRQFLEKLLPTVKHEDVLKQLPKDQQERMEKEPLLSPETYLKNKRAEIKELEQELIYIQGQKNSNDSTLTETEELIEKTMFKLQETINQIKSESGKNTGDLTAEEKEIVEKIYTRLNELKENSIIKHNHMEKLKGQLDLISNELQRLQTMEYESASIDNFTVKNEELKKLYEDFINQKQFIADVSEGYTCPYCYHKVDANNIDKFKTGLQTKLQDTSSKGNVLKQEVENLRIQSDIDKSNFTEEKNEKIFSYKNQAAQLQEQIIEVENYIKNNKESINELNSTIELMEEDFKKRKSASIHEQSKDAQRESEIQLDTYKKIVEEKENNKIKYQQKLDDINISISHLQEKIRDAVAYLGERNKLLFGSLPMNKVKISLTHIVKGTGEIKDTFQYTYDGREYFKLSLSEKIKAGLEVTNLVKQLTNKYYPTYIDNSESVCSFGSKPNSQMFLAYVKKDSSLEVIVKNMDNAVEENNQAKIA